MDDADNADQMRTIVRGFLVHVLDFHIGKSLKCGQRFRGPFEYKEFERSLPDFPRSSEVNVVFLHHLLFSYCTNTVPGISSTLHRYYMHVAVAVIGAREESRNTHQFSIIFLCQFLSSCITRVTTIRDFQVKNASTVFLSAFWIFTLGKI